MSDQSAKDSLEEPEPTQLLLGESLLDEIPVLRDLVDQKASAPEQGPVRKTRPPETNTSEIKKATGKQTKVAYRGEEQNDMFTTLDHIFEVGPSRVKEEQLAVEPLIQSIIDEAIPMFEEQLRKRLSAAAPEIIRQLAKQYTNT